MADTTTLDIMRADAFFGRVKNGGNRIAWSAADVARIHGHIKSLPEEKIIRAAPTAVRKFEQRAS
jgi:hypothetical protein